MNETLEPADNPSFKGMMIVSAVAVVAMVIFAAWAWMQIGPDEKIPTHWGPGGEADGFGSRNSLFLMPSVAAGIVLLFVAIPRFEPRRGHLLRSSKAYKVTWLGVLGFFAIFHGAVVLAALDHAVPMLSVVSVGIGALFVLVGNFLGKVRSNFMFGVRTPWTLSSELSWNKTHRLSGWMFVIWGILLAISGIADPKGTAMLWLVLGGAAIVIGIAFVYSYLVWKNDPARNGERGRE